MKVVVTGAAGFIGANLIRGLNAMGINDVIAVDELTAGVKSMNLQGTNISDYLDKSAFYDSFERGAFGRVDAIMHEGGCSDTMQHNRRFMMEANVRCSKRLLEACLRQGTRLLYASSAATYGASNVFREDPAYEAPLNVYGYSKLLFDNVVRRAGRLPVQVAGFRYFNVYGPYEQHKGKMASVVFHHYQQFRKQGKVVLFGEYGSYGPGEQRRDFVHVDDVVKVKLWFLEHPHISGIFNLGTGRAQPFNKVAMASVNTALEFRGEAPLEIEQMVKRGYLEYVGFPEALVGRYQCYTQADIAHLRSTGCPTEFTDVAAGVARYISWLCARDGVQAPGLSAPTLSSQTRRAVPRYAAGS